MQTSSLHERRHSLAEVDEVIRASIAAGELIIRISEEILVGSHGRPGLIRSLVDRLVRERGGAGAQVPADALARRNEPMRAVLIPISRLEEVRGMAEAAGIQFSAAASGREGYAIVRVAERDHALLRDICRVLEREEEKTVPDLDGAPDIGLADFGPGTTIDACTVPAEQAAAFERAASDDALAYVTTDPAASMYGCLKADEIIYEQAEGQMHAAGPGAAAAWESIVSSGPAAAADLARDQFAALRVRSPDVPAAAAPGKNGRILIVVPFQDRARLREAAPGAMLREVVHADELRRRMLCAPRSEALVLVPGGERDRAERIARAVCPGARWADQPAAQVMAQRESLRSRMDRLLAGRAPGGTEPDRTCDLSHRDAAAFREAAAHLGIPVRAKTISDGVRLMVPRAFSVRASALLEARGIPGSFRAPEPAQVDRAR